MKTTRLVEVAKNLNGNSRIAAVFRSILCLIISLCLLTSCKNSERTWFAESKSPDGKIIATAETLEPGGWGTGAPAQTDVSINWTSGSQNPTQIFSFNDGPDEPGGMKIGMNWLSAKHLELTYKGHPSIEFEAIKWQEVVISTRNISTNARSTTLAP